MTWWQPIVKYGPNARKISANTRKPQGHSMLATGEGLITHSLYASQAKKPKKRGLGDAQSLPKTHGVPLESA